MKDVKVKGRRETRHKTKGAPKLAVSKTAQKSKHKRKTVKRSSAARSASNAKSMLAKSIEPPPGNPLSIRRLEGETPSTALARSVLRPVIQAAITVHDYGRESFGDLELATLVDQLEAGAEEANGGNLDRAEATLMSQAAVLDAIFHTLVRRAWNNVGSSAQAYEVFMRFGLRAQAQCARTLEVLATMKNPPIVITRQANIAAGGPQQINNGSLRVEKVERPKNKLSGHSYELLPNIGAPAITSQTDPTMEAVGKINGSENARR